MPDCYICSPVCDNCKPKFVVCLNCGMRTLLDLPVCPNCGNEITQEERDLAYADWLEKHSAQQETTAE